MKRHNFWSRFIIMVVFCSTNITATVSKHTLKIRILHSASHVAFDSTALGLIDGLKKLGYITDDNLFIEEDSAQGNAVMASQIASKFIQQQPEIIFALGTLAVQSFLKPLSQNTVKVVFASVTDPIAAGVLLEKECQVHDVTGVSNFVPLEPQVALMLKMQPNLKSLGMLYNSGEANSVGIIEKMRVICNEKGIEFVAIAITKTSELAQATARLASKVDAIFVSNDNTCLSGIQSIYKAALELNKPVYCSDTDQVQNGAIAALGPNQYALGIQSANLIEQYLKGKKLSQLPIQYPETQELYINLDVAKKINLEIPKAVLESAQKVIERPTS